MGGKTPPDDAEHPSRSGAEATTAMSADSVSLSRPGALRLGGDVAVRRAAAGLGGQEGLALPCS